MNRHKRLATLMFDRACRRAKLPTTELTRLTGEAIEQPTLTRQTIASWRAGATDVPFCAFLGLAEATDQTYSEVVIEVIAEHPDLITDAQRRVMSQPQLVRGLWGRWQNIRRRLAGNHRA